MYRCEKCKKNSRPGQELNRVVVETRPKEYKNTVKIKGRRQVKYSKGYETVKEIGICKKCDKRKNE